MLRIATSPTEGRPWHSAKLCLFARGSPTRGAVERSETERLDGRRTARRSVSLPVIEVINFHSTPFYHTFPLATRLNGQKTAKMGKKVEKMRRNHSAAAPQSHKTLGKKTPESPKIPLQLGCSVTQIRHFFKRTFFNLPLIFENNVKKATVWLHERGRNLPVSQSLSLWERCHRR